MVRHIRLTVSAAFFGCNAYGKAALRGAAMTSTTSSSRVPTKSKELERECNDR